MGRQLFGLAAPRPEGRCYGVNATLFLRSAGLARPDDSFRKLL